MSDDPLDQPRYMEQPGDKRLNWPTQAVTCPRCGVECSPSYPHASVEDCNDALVGTRIAGLEAERDRLREALTLIRGEAMFASNTRDALRRVETIATAVLDKEQGST